MQIHTLETSEALGGLLHELQQMIFHADTHTVAADSRRVVNTRIAADDFSCRYSHNLCVGLNPTPPHVTADDFSCRYSHQARRSAMGFMRTIAVDDFSCRYSHAMFAVFAAQRTPIEADDFSCRYSHSRDGDELGVELTIAADDFSCRYSHHDRPHVQCASVHKDLII